MAASLDHITPNTPMGATLVDGGATFRVWAPNAFSVHVRGSFNGYNVQDDAALVREDHGYWHGFISGVRDRDTFKYWIDGQAGPEWKRDPYARELVDPGWDCVVRNSAFPWHNTGYQTPQFNNFVIYQLHVGAFYAPRFPSAGTFLDVVDKIPHLADIGVTALQLLPIQEFPGNFSLGYNGTDYFSPEMAYRVADADLGPYVSRANALLQAKGLAPFTAADLRGEMNQLKALVDICHLYGLGVIFDLVFNHAGGDFGTQTLWFFDRQRGADSNPPWWWNSLYFSDQTWAGGVVFNFQSDPVRGFLIDNAQFFVDEYRVDGLRFDEVSVIDHEGYGRGWDFLQALTNTIRTHKPGVLMHAEYWPYNPWIVRDPWDAGGGGFHTTMTDAPRQWIREAIRLASIPGDHELPMNAIEAQIGSNALRDRWRAVNSLENHDLVMQPKDDNDHDRVPRLARLADPSNSHSWYASSRCRVANGLLLTMPGIPMLFMGQEFLEDKQWSDDVPGHPELLLYWSGADGGDATMVNFQGFMRELIRLRWQFPALRAEGYQRLHAHDQNRVIAFQRWVPGEGGTVIVVASLANDTKYGYEIGFPDGGHWREVFNSEAFQVNPWGVDANRWGREGFSQSAALTIPANSLLVFAR